MPCPIGEPSSRLIASSMLLWLILAGSTPVASPQWSFIVGCPAVSTFLISPD
jgi:hypothetical protein